MREQYSITDRLQHGWNAFRNKDPVNLNRFDQPLLSSSSSFRPDRIRPIYSIDPTMITSIFTRIAIDAASHTFEHIKTDQDGGYASTVESSLNNIFNMEANLDQTGQEFILEIFTSMLDEGCIACVPIETSKDPEYGLGGYDIDTIRVGKIKNWWADRIAVELYNERTAMKETRTFMKRSIAILTNPFYSIMNESNSTLKRLNRRLALLDASDERVGSSKLDMIIQLPYVVKTESRKKLAETRRDQLVTQLQTSEYGIAYADGTEKIIQLNRPVENNLTANIEYLTNLLFSQLGLTPEIMNMTASEQTMINYYKRIIDPLCDTVVNEYKRKFLTKTARSQKQTIWYHTEPFKFTQTSSLADIADKMIRNQILTSNEFRGVIGYKPSDDPNANILSNPNMPQIEPTLVDGGAVSKESQEVGSLPISSLMA